MQISKTASMLRHYSKLVSATGLARNRRLWCEAQSSGERKTEIRSHSLILMLFCLSVGCGSISGRVHDRCDIVHLPNESVPTSDPIVELEAGETVSDSTVCDLKPIPLGRYDKAPNSCRPHVPQEVQHVEWKVRSSHARTTVNRQEAIPLGVSNTKVVEKTDDKRCLPMLEALKIQTENESSKLSKKVSELENSLNNNQVELAEMFNTLEKSNLKIEKLNGEINLYKEKLTKLETSIEKQHLADLRVLDSLSIQLAEILDETGTQ